ncbi:MAG TPA: Gfo/Idh/MocA family oxidoreductase [Bryobacteraceae bacterium]|nr:Gfo/Idh/MocA family oxidoreductase [Bryobacteraceae bacterium]
MTRRTALALAAAGAGAYAADKPPIGIGFIGISHSHAEGKLAVVKASPHWKIVAVAESDPKFRDVARKMGLTLVTREELLAHPGIQVVAVESAVRDHAPDGLAVLKAGKHLHLEKAPADSMAGFEKIVSLARSKSLLLQVGYMWRYHTAIAQALEAGKKGWLGSIYLVKATMGNQLAVKRRPEWAEFAGGNMFELGGHVIDPMIRLMGKPRDVKSILRTDGDFKDSLKDNTLAIFQWDKALGIVHGSNLQPGSSRYRAFEIHGTNGAAIVNPIEAPVLTIDLEKAAGPYVKGVQKVPVPPYERYVDDMVELAAAVRGESKLRVTYEEDLMVHEALLRASGMY